MDGGALALAPSPIEPRGELDPGEHLTGLRAERRDALDAHLWTFRDDSFLGHGTDRDPHAEDQPVLLTTGDQNPNGARIRFLVDGASPPDLSAYERAVFLFDGHDAAQVEAAREHWKVMKGAGHAVTYWQQTPDRRWERKA